MHPPHRTPCPPPRPPAVVGNKDIEPFIPTLVSCIARPDEVSECVYKLSATTFVQAVEPPTLAIMEPVLERGL